ncbi:MAG: hypothetical protein ACLQJR_33180 [Stellaceae bacterium]
MSSARNSAGSFAYGNTKIENERVTRRMVDEQADALKRRADG